MTLFHSKDGRLRNGWKIAGFVATLAILIFLVQILIPRGHRNFPGTQWMPFTLVMAATLLALWLEKESLSSLAGKLNRRWGLEFLVGTLGGVLILVLAALGAMGLGAVRLSLSGLSPVGLLTGAWTFLAVAFFEEALFRGYPFQRLVRGMGFWPTQGLMAALFALAHWGNPGMQGATRIWATIDIALAAVLFGLCWQRTQSLALPIGLHLGWNWAQGSLMGFGVSGGQFQGWLKPEFLGKPEWMSGGTFGLEASLPGVVVVMLACGLVLLKPKPILEGSLLLPTTSGEIEPQGS